MAKKMVIFCGSEKDECSGWLLLKWPLTERR